MGKLSSQQAIKKVQIAIDKMIDLQDGGFGCDKISRILEYLNDLEREWEFCKTLTAR